ncbi:hypothetical protein Btru_065650 [Bulinus truncatus]|nr:hypothetical protein Btru_065650 [Bulinus truncatus]
MYQYVHTAAVMYQYVHTAAVVVYRYVHTAAVMYKYVHTAAGVVYRYVHTAAVVVYRYLASEMLRLFDPTLDTPTEPPEEALNLIPIYRSPKIVSAYLPDVYWHDRTLSIVEGGGGVCIRQDDEY